MAEGTSIWDADYAKQAREALDSWSDERYMSRDGLRALWVFTEYLDNVAEDDGWAYDGHSWRAGTPLGVLVVKATMGDAPVVCFNSARTFLGAVRIFIRKLEEQRVEWMRDKFRG